MTGGAEKRMLQGKRIVLGVCGGIAAYKAADLTSKLQQAGALVDVILTERAGEFVRPLSFASLSHRPVYESLWEPTGEAAARHIELGAGADLLLVAPATANTIAKLAHGLADDMLTAVALACPAPLVLAPAMESHMYRHPATQANLKLLEARGATIIPPEEGHLASGEVGIGRFPETAVILAEISHVLGRQGGDLAGKRVVVTAGGTQEPIDPVRYVGNRSSGRMGFALAEEARDRGADVTLIAGAVVAPLPHGMAQVRRVGTALELREAVREAVREADVLVMAAAVADYRPEAPAAEKIKKGSAAEGRDGSLTLRLMRNPDILAELAESEAGGAGAIRVGFAAETTDVAANAADKLRRKRLALLVANDVGKPGSGFGTATNEVTLYQASGRVEQLALLPKSEVAAAIWDRVVPLLRERETAE
ncbi:MAG TPA: bifunctional phosphopantothenoylcysteine decarboxylase/phosphopantothenate--cysteine ligase CoaBC [Ktedonobacterales bacterium]